MTLLAKLKKADKLYYEDGTSPLTDEQYKKLKDKFAAENPKHPYLKEVGSPVTVGTKKKLPVICGSLDKQRPDDIPGWIKPHDTEYYVLSPKFDGLTLELEYINGVLNEAYTRGNGVIGRVVTDTVRHIQGVPKQLHYILGRKMPGRVIIKGEAVIHVSIFQKLYKGKVIVKGQRVYNNERNFAAGMVNRKKPTAPYIEALKNMTFIAYSINTIFKGKTKWRGSKHNEYTILQQFGLTTPSNPSRYSEGHYFFLKKIKEGKYGEHQKAMLPIRDSNYLKVFYHKRDLTPEFLRAHLTYLKSQTDILLDGLVLEINEREVAKEQGYAANGLNPNWACSIKLDQSEQEAKVGIVKEIFWDMSRRKLYKPVIVLKKPLDFNGVQVTNISGFNARFVVDMGLKAGVKVKIIRSGDVIPVLMAVMHKDKWVVADEVQTTIPPKKKKVKKK